MNKFSRLSIAGFKSLRNITGFNAVVKNINSAKDEKGAESHFYLLGIGQNLQKLEGLKLKAFESGEPPKDVIFIYKGIKYAVEIKVLYIFNRAKEVNKPPYRMKLGELPKKLPKFDPKYDYAKIIDTINKAYNQLDKGCVNIIILISKAGWVDPDDIRDVWDILFVKNQADKYSLLTALVFCDITTKNYIFQNLQAPHNIDEELKSHIEKCKFEDIGAE